MNVNQDIIAFKYAHAFYNLYGNDLSEHDFWHIRSAASSLKYIPGVLFFLTLVGIEVDTRKKMIQLLLKKLKLPETFLRLIELLMQHKRIGLLPQVLHACVDIYQRKNRALLFTMTTPIPVSSDDDKKEIESFLQRLSGCHILAEYTIDKKLIAGMRALNKNYLWEYSIESKMWSITNSLV